MTIRALSLPLLLTATACGGPGAMTSSDAPRPAAILRRAAPGAGATPTWYRDVQPIAQARCVGCHVTGGIAPFDLTGYDEAFARRDSIAAYVEARRMPPWLPAEGCQPLRDSRRLPQEEVDTILAWVAAGAPAGDPSEAPSTVAPPAAGLTSVDARLDPGVDYLPQAGHEGHGHDDYRCFALDPALDQDRDIIGVEVVPGQPTLVHHVLLFAAPAAAVRAADDADPGPGWTCFGGPGVAALPAVVGGWAPGSGATRAPEGTGVPLAAGTALVMQVHYNLDYAPPAPDRTVVLLQYAQGRVAKPARVLPLADLWFAIPPGASGYRATASLPFASVATLWGVAPHMHTLGRHIRVEKDGACLIDIPSWDFHWQQVYFLRDPVTIAAGSRVTLSCTWDNPTDRVITWGEGTSDEMCLSYLYLTF